MHPRYVGPRRPITIRLLDGSERTFKGQTARTLRLLIERGPVGLTAAECPPAFRLAAYIGRLGKGGVHCDKTTEADTRLARYRLRGPVAVVKDGGGGDET